MDLSDINLFGWEATAGIYLGWDGWLADSTFPIYLERKTAYDDFSPISKVEWIHKSFIDTAVVHGNSYQYRLVQVYPDGNILYSDAVEIYLSGNRTDNKLVVYPNPSDGLLWTEISLAEQGQWNISILNSLGQTIHQNTLFLTVGMNKLTIDLQNQSRGVYLLKMTPTDGTNFEKGYEQRIIKSD